MTETIAVSNEVRTSVDHGVALLTISHPERRNAMNLELSGKLVAALDAAVADPAVGAVVITGEPPAFCAGGDLSELQGADSARLKSVYAGFLAVAECPLPTVAAVNGAAVGAGLNLALACDLRLAGPRAKFDARFMQLGLHPGGGYTWMIDRALGTQGAKALTLFCDVLDATEAERVGLVWRCYHDDAALLAGALELARRAAAAPRNLIATTKSTMRVTSGSMSHREATEIEVRAQAASIDTDEFRERVTALQTRISKG